MKKLILTLFISVSMILLSSCTVNTVSYDPGYSRVVYDPGYSNDYVYSVGYYSNRPYWGNNYYVTSYGMGDYGYWSYY